MIKGFISQDYGLNTNRYVDHNRTLWNHNMQQLAILLVSILKSRAY